MGLPQGMSGEEDLERVWRVKSGEWRQEVALVRLIVLLLTKKTCHCEEGEARRGNPFPFSRSDNVPAAKRSTDCHARKADWLAMTCFLSQQ